VKTRISLAVALATCALVAPTAAHADSTASVVDDINQAVSAQPAAATSPIDGDQHVTIPSTGDQRIRLTTVDTSVSIALPADGEGDEHGQTTVFDGSGQDAQIAAQPTLDGVRALVHIDGPSAPERYSFTIGGDVKKLYVLSDGSVAATDADGSALGVLAAPWATDANGTAVPTHYEVDGTTLTQVVEHKDGSYSYGITADPHWGWVHYSRALSKTETLNVIRFANNSRNATAVIGAAFGAVSGPGGIVLAHALTAFGFGQFASNLSDALARSNNRGTQIDAGLRCASVPFLPDPCWPEIWTRPR